VDDDPRGESSRGPTRRRMDRPSGHAQSPFSIGRVSANFGLDAEPLVTGGVAIAARASWLFQIREGSSDVSPAEWLSVFPNTRLALVRGGRAHALLPGAPDPDPVSDPCSRVFPIALTAADGRTCGTVSFPAPTVSTLACINAVSSVGVGRDGTVVSLTFEYGQAQDGSTGFHGIARWWPEALR
jgi:hypothetical protein